jgi:hypothetical protein
MEPTLVQPCRHRERRKARIGNGSAAEQTLGCSAGCGSAVDDADELSALSGIAVVGTQCLHAEFWSRLRACRFSPVRGGFRPVGIRPSGRNARNTTTLSNCRNYGFALLPATAAASPACTRSALVGFCDGDRVARRFDSDAGPERQLHRRADSFCRP